MTMESETKTNGKKVLYIGFSCLDHVNIIDKFPTEDSEQEVLKYYWQRGGNASNCSTVSTFLSVPCEFFGVLATQGLDAKWLMDDFQKAGVCIDHCVLEEVSCFLTICMTNIATGTRTFLYCPRGYRCASFADFNSKFGKDFSGYSWIHFELTPNSEDILAMMEQVEDYNGKCRAEGRPPVAMSVEIEKPDCTNTDPIMKLADFVFVSKDFARARGHSTASLAVQNLYGHCKDGATLICAWGDKGATLRKDDFMFTAPARTDVKIVDTLGAGDTFNASFIAFVVKTGRVHLLSLEDLKDALTSACQVAGYKCSIYGYDGLKSYSCPADP